MEWIYIDNFDFSPEHPYIHCDTRDFHLIGMSQEHTKIPYNNNVFTLQEIKDFLKKLETESGGKKKWRCINWKGDGPGWWKYLRFKKIDNDKYLGYTTSGNRYYPLYKSMTPETIVKEFL